MKSRWVLECAVEMFAGDIRWPKCFLSRDAATGSASERWDDWIYCRCSWSLRLAGLLLWEIVLGEYNSYISVRLKSGGRGPRRDRRGGRGLGGSCSLPICLSCAVLSAWNKKSRVSFGAWGGLCVESYIVWTQLSGDLACARSCTLPLMKSLLCLLIPFELLPFDFINFCWICWRILPKRRADDKLLVSVLS